MANPAWGTKRVCQSCSAIYYDMKKTPPVCPTCGTKFDPEALLKSRRGRNLPDEPARTPLDKKEAVVADEMEALDDVEIEDAELDDEDEDDALIEDASELGENDDDVGLTVEGGVEH